MTSERTKTTAYWVSTALVCAAMGFGAIAYLVRLRWNMEGIARLGYPAYLVSILGVWKVLSVVTLLAPGFPRLKEWAYAGVAFTLSGAVVSHLVVGEYGLSISPAILFGLNLLSWALRPASRRLESPRANHSATGSVAGRPAWLAG